MKLEDIRRVTNDEVFNAIITSVQLTTADHGCLTAWINTRFKDGGGAFGGYRLGLVEERLIDNNCAEFIIRCLAIGEVDEWVNLKGKPIRVLQQGGEITAIGHFLANEWFCPKQEFK